MMACEQTQVTDVYNEIANNFSKTRASKWEWVSDYVENIPKGSNLLDIGCGNGRNMNYDGYHFIGVDSSKEFVKICKSSGYNAEICDMCYLPFDNESFDGILSIASFHHLSNQQRRIECLKEMYRVLKPGGTILISVWSKEQPKQTKRVFENYGDVIVKWNNLDKIYNRYYYIFELRELRNLFCQVNLKIVTHKWIYGNEVFILQK